MKRRRMVIVRREEVGCDSCGREISAGGAERERGKCVSSTLLAVVTAR